MHSTLTVRLNIILIALWTAAIAVTLLVFDPKPFTTILVGTLFGIPCGLLQSRALIGSSADIVTARTAFEVRKVLLATRTGKRVLQLQWIGATGVFVSAFLQDANPLAAVLSGYCALMLFRDVITIKAVVKLKHEKTVLTN